MEAIKYTRVICDVWTYWKQHPDELTKLAAYKRDMSYILYRITGKNYFITKNDSDVINKIVDRLLGVGPTFAYGTGLSKRGMLIGGVVEGTIGSAILNPFHQKPEFPTYAPFTWREYDKALK
jgi:hypothetical protein